MTVKYVALVMPPKSWSSDSYIMEMRPSCEVIETDKAPQPIGILDRDGTPIYRTVETVALGFKGKNS